MTVTISVTQIVMTGDTAQVSYTLSNSSQSQDSLFMFIVDAPARVKTIPRPQPDSDWIVDSLVHADRSIQALIARLRTLSQTVCAAPLNWITNATLCSQLISDLDAAEGFRATGATSQVQSTLDHYKSLLGTSTSFATGVNSAAYWMLSANADIIRNSV
jgi:hypothetical protein